MLKNISLIPELPGPRTTSARGLLLLIGVALNEQGELFSGKSKGGSALD